MLLPRRLMLLPQQPKELRTDLSPLQLGLGGSPWHVTVASILLCRARRDAARTDELFRRWPTPDALTSSDVELEQLLKPLGLHRQRARHIQQLSRKWDTYNWFDLRELQGVGSYVAAAVELFCFGHTFNVSCDYVLENYAAVYSGPRMSEAEGWWFVDGIPYDNPEAAYAEYCARNVT